MAKRLPEEVRVPLTDAHGLPGCTALLRPMDVEDKARFSDDMNADVGFLASCARACKRALLALDGLEVEEKAGEKPVAFNPRNTRHWAVIPVEATTFLAGELLRHTTLTEEQEKNSGSPSGSGGTSPGAS